MNGMLRIPLLSQVVALLLKRIYFTSVVYWYSAQIILIDQTEDERRTMKVARLAFVLCPSYQQRCSNRVLVCILD